MATLNFSVVAETSDVVTFETHDGAQLFAWDSSDGAMFIADGADFTTWRMLGRLKRRTRKGAEKQVGRFAITDLHLLSQLYAVM